MIGSYWIEIVATTCARQPDSVAGDASRRTGCLVRPWRASTVIECEARACGRTEQRAARASTRSRGEGPVMRCPSHPPFFAGFAADHGLWVVADEVYEDFVYQGTHVPTRPFLPDRTFASYSFSKAYGMAGNRVGYVVGPVAGMVEVSKVGIYSFYSAPTASQLAAQCCSSSPSVQPSPTSEVWLANHASNHRTPLVTSSRLPGTGLPLAPKKFGSIGAPC